MSKPEFVTVVIPRMVFRVPVERVSADAPTCLTPAEMLVFKHLVYGKTNKEIANAINCSESNIKHHIVGIYRKLNVKAREEFLIQYGRIDR